MYELTKPDLQRLTLRELASLMAEWCSYVGHYAGDGVDVAGILQVINDFAERGTRPPDGLRVTTQDDQDELARRANRTLARALEATRRAYYVSQGEGIDRGEPTYDDVVKRVLDVFNAAKRTADFCGKLGSFLGEAERNMAALTDASAKLR